MHWTDGELRAYADGALPTVQRVRCSMHLARCATCRHLLLEVRSLETRTASLLTLAAPRIDAGEAWAQLASVRGARPAKRIPWRSLAAAAALVAITLFGIAMRDRIGVRGGVRWGARAQDVCCFNLDGGPGAEDGVFTLSRASRVVDCVVIYDDRDHSRSLSRGDSVRYQSSANSCGPFVASRRQAVPAVDVSSISSGGASARGSPASPAR